MAVTQAYAENEFVALRSEFVLKVDGGRPILYPVDHRDITTMFLNPWEGMALALLDGQRPWGVARSLYEGLFPVSVQEGSGIDFDHVVTSLNTRVRATPQEQNLGPDGLYEVSRSPIGDAVRYDPRDFVVSPEDLARREQDPRTRRRLETPIAIATVFTHHCFTKCVYCYAERPRVPEMSLERWRELLDEMVELGIHIVLPDNGDVLARPDGMQMLEMVLERDLYFFLSTKAALSVDDVRRLTDAGMGKPVRNRLRPIQLSFDAVDEEVSTRLLGVKHPRVELNTQTFVNLREAGLDPRIKAVITSLNVDQILPLVEHFYPFGARRFAFVRYVRTFHRHSDELFLRPEHGDAIRRQLEAIAEQYPDVVVDEDLRFGADSSFESLTPERRKEIWENRNGCGGGWGSLGISANGDAFLCEQMVLQEPYVVGDAKVQSLREIWDGERLKNFIFPTRTQFKDAICGACPEFEECMWEQGRCYRDAFFAYGSVFEPPPLCPRNDRPGLKIT